MSAYIFGLAAIGIGVIGLLQGSLPFALEVGLIACGAIVAVATALRRRLDDD